MPPAQAQRTVYDELNHFEKIMFGEPQQGGAVEARLAALEKNVFGKSRKGPVAERLEELHKMLDTTSKSSEYLPAIAPAVDRSEHEFEPKMAPDATATHRDRAQLLDTADNSERVKGMLRDAMSLYSQGNLAEAERVYQKVLGIDFRNADANFNLGAIAEEQGKLKEAAGFYRSALAANPDDADTKDALKGVTQKLASQPAITTPTDPPSRFKEVSSTPALERIAADAASAYKDGKYDDAIVKLNYLLKQTPYDASVHFALGQALKGRGDNQSALRHLRAACTLEPKNDIYRKAAEQTEQMGLDDPQITASADSRKSGELTPFVMPGQDSGVDHELDLADLRGLFFGGVPGRSAIELAPIGSAQAWDVSFGMGNNGSLRLRRVVQSSLAGAAMGAMQGRGMPGGVRRGATRGAMYGGMYGLMFGGY